MRLGHNELNNHEEFRENDISLKHHTQILNIWSIQNVFRFLAEVPYVCTTAQKCPSYKHVFNFLGDAYV